MFAPTHSAIAAEQILAVVAELQSTYKIDAANIHACGFSQGAVVTWQLYCAAPSLWASIAPVSGGGCVSNGVPAVAVPVRSTSAAHSDERRLDAL